MDEYEVHWRHITLQDMFTPMMYLGVERSRIKSKENATESDIQIAVAESFKSIGIKSENVSVVKYYSLTKDS